MLTPNVTVVRGVLLGRGPRGVSRTRHLLRPPQRYGQAVHCLHLLLPRHREVSLDPPPPTIRGLGHGLGCQSGIETPTIPNFETTPDLDVTWHNRWPRALALLGVVKGCAVKTTRCAAARRPPWTRRGMGSAAINKGNHHPISFCRNSFTNLSITS